jgi:hypothetical protein
MADNDSPTSLRDLGYQESIRGIDDYDDMGDGGARRFYGKYRAIVVNNFDPLFQGRLWVESADVHGIFPANWAMPCIPWAGMMTGTYIIPPLLAKVWVEFEAGNPEKPIWVGGFWGDNPLGPSIESPGYGKTLAINPAVAGVGAFTILTAGLGGLVITDAPAPPLPAGGVMIFKGANFITVGVEGITLTSATAINIIAPSINLASPGVINIGGTKVNVTGVFSVNVDALVVT